MKFYAFIPARYGSSRYPGKPLMKIAGKMMIQHVYERSCCYKGFSDVFVVTDDERISNAVFGFGGKAIISEYEHMSGTDRIYEAVCKLGFNDEDIIVNIQGDQPVFDLRIIDSLLEPFNSDTAVSVVTVGFRITNTYDIENSNNVKTVINKEGYALYFSRSIIPYDRDRQNNVTYFKHLGFYAYSMKALEKFSTSPVGTLEFIEKLEQLRFLENSIPIRFVETSYDSPEVDCPEHIDNIERFLMGADEKNRLIQ